MKLFIPDSVADEVYTHEIEEDRIKGLDPKTTLMAIDAIVAVESNPEYPNVMNWPKFEITEDVWASTGDPDGRGHHYGIVLSPTGKDNLAEQKAKEILARWRETSLSAHRTRRKQVSPEKIRKAAQENLCQSIQHTVGSCNIEIDGKEIEFDWENGKAIIHDELGEEWLTLEVKVIITKQGEYHKEEK
jgi:hypothetical protein